MDRFSDDVKESLMQLSANHDMTFVGLLPHL